MSAADDGGSLGSEDPPGAPRRRVLIRVLVGFVAVAVLLVGVAGGLCLGAAADL